MKEAGNGHRRTALDRNGTQHSEDAAAWIQLASALMKNDRYEEALEMLHLAIQCDPGNGGAWLGLGKAYYLVGRLTEARAALDIARRNRASAARVDRYLGRIAEMERARTCWTGGGEHPEISISEADLSRGALLSDGGEVAEQG